MNDNIDFAEDHPENLVCLRLNISKKGQAVQIEVDENMKLTELFSLVAEYAESEEKFIRLIYKGDRISKDANKTVRQQFTGQNEEITVFFESTGASL